MSKTFVGDLMVAQLMKMLFAFYGARRSIPPSPFFPIKYIYFLAFSSHILEFALFSSCHVTGQVSHT